MAFVIHIGREMRNIPKLGHCHHYSTYC